MQGVWKDYFNTIWKLPTIISEEIGPIKAWFSFLVSITAVIGGISWSPTSLWGLVLMAFVTFHALLKRTVRVNKRLEPKFEILCKKSPPYKRLGYQGDDLFWKIGIKNRSEAATIDDVVVRLMNIDPLPANVTVPIELRQKGDPYSPQVNYLYQFKLNPLEEEHIDVIKEEVIAGTAYAWFLQPATSRLSITEEGYRLTIKVTGRDVPARLRDFKAHKGGQGRLELEPVGDSYEDKQ